MKVIVAKDEEGKMRPAAFCVPVMESGAHEYAVSDWLAKKASKDTTLVVAELTEEGPYVGEEK